MGSSSGQFALFGSSLGSSGPITFRFLLWIEASYIQIPTAVELLARDHGQWTN
jgi:hypothetical protein